MNLKKANEGKMQEVEKIKLDLFQLKSKKNLETIYDFFNEHLKDYFDKSGKPIGKFFDQRDCPICGSDSRKHSFDLDHFSYYECESCSSVYTFPFLKEEIIGKLYTSGAYDEYQKKLVHSSSGLRRDLLDKRKVDQIESFLPTRGDLLDVGCGQGTFLKSCKDRGWNVSGVDPSAKSAQLAKEKFDIHVENKFFSELEGIKKFDCITFWGVLEHLMEPPSAVEKASELCKEGGVVMFEVPSSDCLLSKYLQKSQSLKVTRYIESGRHNIFFSKKGIEMLLNSNGFKLEAIETNGLDIQTILLEEFSEEITKKILFIQDVLNDTLLGDHYRVFARKI